MFNLYEHKCSGPPWRNGQNPPRICKADVSSAARHREDDGDGVGLPGGGDGRRAGGGGAPNPAAFFRRDHPDRADRGMRGDRAEAVAVHAAAVGQSRSCTAPREVP